MLVVKVGGSLFDSPHLGEHLRAWIKSRPERPILLIAGGGDFAEAVRKLDTIHGLGETTAHELALQTMILSACLLRHLLPEAIPTDTPHVANRDVFILGSLERIAGISELPQSWDVTSDSIATLVATRVGACGLVLLKSRSLDDNADWYEAAESGIVDRHFPQLAQQYGGSIGLIDFRTWMIENG